MNHYLLTAAALVCIVFASCSKKKGPGSATPAEYYYITGTFNGTEMTFDGGPWFTVARNHNRVEHLVFAAYEKHTGLKTQQLIQFGIDMEREGGNISEGNTYLNDMEATSCVYSPDGYNMLHEYTSHDPDPENFQLVITRMDDKTMTGTFQGIIKEYNGG